MDKKKSPEENKNKRGKMNSVIRAFSLLTSLGLSMTVCVLIGVFLGRYLDQIFNTSPALLLIFSLLGAFSAIKLLYDTVIKE
ncbi:AtpZ/AtpI family protein [Anaeropeptidivorans aminofermentans]|jgi:ATP synthase protein I|uniref:AtpZ/AtpI family protein n=1 Tax=Anaeropeptidivorans aminofermentans TaxID=2934315 RepID=UPI00202432D8|nr:AtpZ/AtpI family protein [Anaeropeptidivorans aminofermentans]MBE6011059.1 AtpZ/AtpI family protein [Lachnospiraceae bacterium]